MGRYPRPISAHDDIDLSGTWAAAPADEPTRLAALADPSPPEGWEPIPVPGHWRSVPAFSSSDGPLLYRRELPEPARFGPGADEDGPGADRRRTWLVLDGTFYSSDVWLGTRYLGDTEGYFFPHAFEVSDALDEGHRGLTVEVSCDPQLDRTAKRNLTGVFQHWDLVDRDTNPGGIWRAVRLEQTGPVRIGVLRAVCSEASDQRAVLALRVVLDASAAGDVEIATTVAGTEDRRAHTLAAGENRVEWTVEIDRPRRWWPWMLGEAHLEQLVVEVRPVGGPLSDRRVRRTGLRAVTMSDWIVSVNGERLYCKGTNLAPTTLAPAEATSEEVRADVALARDAGLDLVRVHAHVARPELYEAADESGMLVWQDMPLQWGYHRSVRRQARRAARELVDLLGHHPSILVWCGHNEPMAIDPSPEALGSRAGRARLAGRWALSQALPSWNRSVLDHAIARVLRHTDGTRPVVAHSGVLPHPPTFEGTDAHLYLGWYHGAERDLEPLLARWPRLARFVTEFGAQAVPDEAGFLEPERWPDLDWDGLWRRYGLQKRFFDRYVPPADFDTFEAWRDATQRYQAEVVRRQAEALRRLKYRPSGGFAQFCLADAQPAVSWALLDHRRRPKPGYDALAAACRPVIVVADRLPERVTGATEVALDVHVVSDDRIAHPDTIVTAHLIYRESERDPVATTSATARRVEADDEASDRAHDQELARWRWRGDVAADDCVRVGSVTARLPDGPGAVELVLSLEGDGVAADNRYAALVVPA